MENFTAYNPTKLHFGKNVTDSLGETVLIYGKRVLLMYGKGSVQKNGIYDKVINQLKSIKAEIYEFSGIKPNPLVDDVFCIRLVEIQFTDLCIKMFRVRINKILLYLESLFIPD